MIDNLFSRNRAGCVTGSQCEHALNVCVAFLVAGDACRSETLRVYNNLSKCFSVNNRVFCFAEIMLALQWFSKLRALVAIKKGSTFLWYCRIQASLFITIFFAYVLCAIMTHFSGR